MTEKRKKPASGGGALAGDVHQAMRSLGWTVPQCEDDVQQAETELSASAAPLPESLSDAATVFNCCEAASGLANIAPQCFLSDPEIEDNLARAARQGGEIPPGIEDRMRRDRRAAERKLNQDENGEDIG